MASEPTVIIEIVLAQKQALRFQALLEAEEGMAVVRCFDPEHKKQQLWTTPSQRDDLLEWLSTLPGSIEVQVTGEWIWSAGGVQA